jgi:hypothetical protein
MLGSSRIRNSIYKMSTGYKISRYGLTQNMQRAEKMPNYNKFEVADSHQDRCCSTKVSEIDHGQHGAK